MFPKSVPKSLLVEAHLLVNQHRSRTASLKETYARFDLETLIALRHRRRVRVAQAERALMADPCLVGAITTVHGHRILASVQAEIDRRIALLRRQTDVKLGRRKLADLSDDDDDAEDDVADDLSAADEGDELEPEADAGPNQPSTPEREAFFRSVAGDVEKLIAGRAASFVRQHPTIGLTAEDVGQDLWAIVLKAWQRFEVPTTGNARAAFFGFLTRPSDGVPGVIDGALNNLLRKEVPRAQHYDSNRTGEDASGEGARERDEEAVPNARADVDTGTGISGDRFAPTDVSDRERAKQELYNNSKEENWPVLWPILDLIFDEPELQNLPESKWLKQFFALAKERLNLSPYQVRKILREDPAVAEFLGPKFDAIEERNTTESKEEREERVTRERAKRDQRRLDLNLNPNRKVTSTFDRRRLT